MKKNKYSEKEQKYSAQTGKLHIGWSDQIKHTFKYVNMLYNSEILLKIQLILKINKCINISLREKVTNGRKNKKPNYLRKLKSMAKAGSKSPNISSLKIL